jgi:hypothetical protein
LTSGATVGASLGAGCQGQRTDRIDGARSPAATDGPGGGEAVYETVVPAGASADEIQSAIDGAAAAAKPGDHAVVRGEPGGYELDRTLTLKSNVFLRNFHFTIADGANATAIQSARFEELSGSGAWIVGDNDMPYNFGLENVHVVGNRGSDGGASVSSFDGHPIGGVALYGKLYLIDDVFVRQTDGIGFYSECGARGGQGDWRDSPESQIRNLQIRGCVGDGIRYRGPHDTHLETAYPHGNGGYGIVVEGKGVGDVPFTGGGIEIGEIHSYSNNAEGNWENPQGNSVGQKFAGAFRATRIHVDNEAILLDNPGVQISHLLLSEGWNGGGARLTAGSAMLGQVEIKGTREKNDFDHDGVRIEGKNVHIGQAYAQRWTGDALVVDANNVNLGAYRTYGVSGYGLKMGDTTTVNSCQLQMQTIQGEEASFYYNGGARNRVVWNGYTPEGRTAYEGEPPGQSDDFYIDASRPGWNSGRSRHAGTATAADGDRVEHGLFGAPSRVSLTPTERGVVAGVDRSNTNDEAFGVALTSVGGETVSTPTDVHWEAIW